MSAPGLNSETANDYTPYAVGGGTSLHFASNRESGETTSDIWRATWNSAAFDAPAKVAGADLVTASEESNPVVTPDELTLFFDSNRVDELDIYVATRASTDDDFGPAALLADLSSADLDAPNWISADGCVLYPTQRVGPSRTYKIFVTTRSP